MNVWTALGLALTVTPSASFKTIEPAGAVLSNSHVAFLAVMLPALSLISTLTPYSPSVVPVANTIEYSFLSEEPIATQLSSSDLVAPLARIVPSKAVILILSTPVKLSVASVIEIVLFNTLTCLAQAAEKLGAVISTLN